MRQLESSSTCLGDLDGDSVFTLGPTTSGATYRAPGDWLVRQGRVHLADYGCRNILDGRDGDCLWTVLLRGSDGKKSPRVALSLTARESPRVAPSPG